MVQDYTIDTFEGSHVAQTDLDNMEENFAALKSSFAGTGSPGNTVAGMLWKDTTQNLLKVRNFDDTAWMGIMQASTSHKMLVYRNDAETGWAIDSTQTDKVVAIKGGSTYTTGGDTAGTWTLSGFSSHIHSGPSHNHVWYVNNAAGSHDQSYDAGGSLDNMSIRQQKTSSFGGVMGGSGDLVLGEDFYTSNAGTGNTGSGTAGHDGTDRIAAIVCTMQYVSI
jgi:hypothetical protein